MPSETARKERRKIMKEVHYALWGSVIAVVIALSSNAVTYQLAKRQARQGHQAHSGLCVFRDSVKKSVDDTGRLLAKHPKAKLIDVDPGENVLLVQRSTLVINRASQLERLKGLDESGLHC